MNTTSLSTKIGNGKGLTLTDYNDGKVHGWNGGDCPVHSQTLIKVFYRGILSNLDYKAKNVYWGHCGGCGDIVAFQVVKEHKEPMVIWVNMYNSGLKPVYENEKSARLGAALGVERVAVKFIEVQE